jgi:hypothetical protein
MLQAKLLTTPGGGADPGAQPAGRSWAWSRSSPTPSWRSRMNSRRSCSTCRRSSAWWASWKVGGPRDGAARARAARPVRGDLRGTAVPQSVRRGTRAIRFRPSAGRSGCRDLLARAGRRHDQNYQDTDEDRADGDLNPSSASAGSTAGHCCRCTRTSSIKDRPHWGHRQSCLTGVRSASRSTRLSGLQQHSDTA